MENPASWKSAELVILDAYEDWQASNSLGAIGASLPATVAWALRNSGHLADQDEGEIGWDKLREHRATRGRERLSRVPSSPVQDDRISQM